MKKKYKILAITTTSFLLLFFLVMSASALGIGDALGNIITTGNVAGYSPNVTFVDIIALIINALLGLVGIMFLIMIIYGGFTWMTAGGSSDKVGKAKKLIINAVIGLIIVTAAYSISYFIASALEAKPQ
jgi:hypothetical protein